jgi:hypothetical protein
MICIIIILCYYSVHAHRSISCVLHNALTGASGLHTVRLSLLGEWELIFDHYILCMCSDLYIKSTFTACVSVLRSLASNNAHVLGDLASEDVNTSVALLRW